MSKHITSSPEQTKKIAGEVLSKFAGQKRSGALVVGLNGELGAGKTQFTQGAAEYLDIERNITSPTFVIMKKYGISKKGEWKNFYHFDCYRVYSSKEIEELDWKEIISNPQNIVFVEWAEKIKNIMPNSALIIDFSPISSEKRELSIRNEIDGA